MKYQIGALVKIDPQHIDVVGGYVDDYFDEMKNWTDTDHLANAVRQQTLATKEMIYAAILNEEDFTVADIGYVLRVNGVTLPFMVEEEFLL